MMDSSDHHDTDDEGSCSAVEPSNEVCTGVCLWRACRDDEHASYLPVTTHDDSEQDGRGGCCGCGGGGVGKEGPAARATACRALALVAVGALVYVGGFCSGEAHMAAAGPASPTAKSSVASAYDEEVESVIHEVEDSLGWEGEGEDDGKGEGEGEGDEPSEPPRAFVCITGQLPRLELRNKIDHLLTPFHSDYGVEIDVALVLSDTDNHSVNRKGERIQAYETVDEVADELASVPGVTVLDRELDIQSADPVVNAKYLEQRGKDSSMTPEQTHERVQNHVRQFESLSHCNYYLARSTKAYDMVHRIREDSGYYRPVDFSRMLALTQEQPMTIVPSGGCDTHGGINDRGAFVSPDAAYDYFVNPIMHMYLRPVPDEVRNTEKFLQVTYSRTCHLKETDEFHIFRIWNKEDGTSSFSPSDVKCIERYHLDGAGEEEEQREVRETTAPAEKEKKHRKKKEG